MAARLARLAALGGGIFLGLVPILVYDELRFGSPLRNGYDFWTPSPFFSWRFAFEPPRGGGTDPNLPFYLRALAGAADLYPRPVAILIGLGLALGACRNGPARRIAGIAGGLAILVLGMQSIFFWQGTRFLLLALPPLLATAALPVAGPRVLRAVALGLLLATSVSLVRAPQLYARDKAFHEPTVLREIAAVMPPNAALLAHTSGVFFSRLVRDGGSDRVWVPLGMDAHEFAIAWHHLQPYARVRDGGAWVRRGLDFARPEGLIDALLAERRPVFLAVPRPSQVPGLPALLERLRAHYRLVPVVVSSRAPVYRVMPFG
jgi:hypothetical protein